MSDDEDFNRRLSELLLKLNIRVDHRVRDIVIEEAEKIDRELASFPISPTSPLSDARRRLDLAYDTALGASLTAIMVSFGITDAQHAIRKEPCRYHNAVKQASTVYADTFRENMIQLVTERGGHFVELLGEEGEEITIEKLREVLSNAPRGDQRIECNWDDACHCTAVRLRRRAKRWVPICDCCSDRERATEQRKASLN